MTIPRSNPLLRLIRHLHCQVRLQVEFRIVWVGDDYNASPLVKSILNSPPSHI